MGFRCASAQCTSDSRKKVSRYPWMSTVRWVKWPKNPKDISRWKHLVRRGGRHSAGYMDVFNVNRRTRLCSRHFDQESIKLDGTATSDPKYFAWNNWGNPINPRSSRGADAAMKENDNDGLDPCDQPDPGESSGLPDAEAEIVNPSTNVKEDHVGELNELQNTHEICRTAEDYLKTSAPTAVNGSTQTSLTSADIEDLLKIRARITIQKTEPVC